MIGGGIIILIGIAITYTGRKKIAAANTQDSTGK